MLLQIVYWLIVCCDAGAIFLVFILGLAAAPSSRTSPLAVAGAILVVPGLFLGLSLWLFLRGNSGLARGAGFVLAAAPILVIAGSVAINNAQMRLNSDSAGNLTFFRAGAMQEISVAITNNDAAKVAALVTKVDVNQRGYSDMTLLVVAMRQLRATPDQMQVLRTLLKAGANPNLTAMEAPLEIAIQISSKTGPEPVRLLLDAGANPNAKSEFGRPFYFGATGRGVHPDILQVLLDHGADLKALDKQGKNVLVEAMQAANWKAVLLLLERGVEWKEIRTPDGRSFKDLIESHNATEGGPGLAAVAEYLRRH